MQDARFWTGTLSLWMTCFFAFAVHIMCFRKRVFKSELYNSASYRPLAIQFVQQICPTLAYQFSIKDMEFSLLFSTNTSLGATNRNKKSLWSKLEWFPSKMNRRTILVMRMLIISKIYMKKNFPNNLKPGHTTTIHVVILYLVRSGLAFVLQFLHWEANVMNTVMHKPWKKFSYIHNKLPLSSILTVSPNRIVSAFDVGLKLCITWFMTLLSLFWSD